MSRPRTEPAYQARKRFGQHFLHDPRVIENILLALGPRPGETIVEIGPGLGALTRPLLERLDAQGDELHVVELDRNIIPLLEAQCASVGRLHVHQGDALQFDFRSLCGPGGKLRLIGNLPYNISSPLLFHLLQQSDCIVDMLFMLQKEVVDRMAASAGEADYGRLSVGLAARAQVENLFAVGRGAFRPPPKVESAIVRVVPRPAPFAIADLAKFDAVVAKAFSQRRKTIANSLKDFFGRSEIEALGLDPKLRPERVTPEQFALLSNHLPRPNPPLEHPPA